MIKNVGTTDKIIRGILAIITAYLGYKYTPWLYIVTTLLIFTIITGHCMPYTWFNINTNR